MMLSFVSGKDGTVLWSGHGMAPANLFPQHLQSLDAKLDVLDGEGFCDLSWTVDKRRKNCEATELQITFSSDEATREVFYAPIEPPHFRMCVPKNMNVQNATNSKPAKTDNASALAEVSSPIPLTTEKTDNITVEKVEGDRERHIRSCQRVSQMIQQNFQHNKLRITARTISASGALGIKYLLAETSWRLPLDNLHGFSDSPSKLKMHSGRSIPQIGLGVFRSKPGEETYNAVKAALSAGYRHIDTAALYQNEVGVGKAVQDSKIPREEIFITTKLWSLSFRGTDGYKFALEEAQKSINRLGTYIDLYLIHSPHHPQHRLDIWRALTNLLKAGKVKSIGVSNYGIHHLKELMKAGLQIPSVNQIEVHPFNQRSELAVFCKSKGILVEAYSPLAKASKFGHPELVRLAEKYKRTEAQIMIRWSIQKGYVTLPKSVNPERIRNNARVFDFKLANEDMQALDKLDTRLVTGWDPTTMA